MSTTNIYKVLTKRLETTLDENQPREPVGFRSKYSTTDHIHSSRKPTEGEVQRIQYPTLHRIRRLRENLRLSANSSSTDLASRTGREDVYIELLKEIYTNISMTIHLQKESNKINIKRGVRQGDTILPELFTTALESIFRRLTREARCLKTDGKYLRRRHTHMR